MDNSSSKFAHLHRSSGIAIYLKGKVRTRALVAGAVIGSGTMSKDNYREVGYSCIAERRGIEIVDTGKPATEFMRYGDTLRMTAQRVDETAPFGVLDQIVVKP